MDREGFGLVVSGVELLDSIKTRISHNPMDFYGDKNSRDSNNGNNEFPY